jgi:hypothetical protein
MTRGNTSTVTAALTINRSVRAPEVLRSEGAVAAPAIVVSCLVDAQLTASPYDFNLNDQRWIERSFLTADTAKWSWFVGPKIGGTQPLVLKLRPIVEMRRVNSSFVTAETSNVQQYEIRASVSVPFSERFPEVMSRIAASFKVAQSLVESITGLLTALAAFLAFVGIKRWRKKRAKPPAGVRPYASTLSSTANSPAD